VHPRVSIVQATARVARLQHRLRCATAATGRPRDACPHQQAGEAYDASGEEPVSERAQRPGVAVVI
jgi:hypothetical protein